MTVAVNIMLIIDAFLIGFVVGVALVTWVSRKTGMLP